ncbi:hypothetical protein [Breoghania sp. JC706]
MTKRTATTIPNIDLAAGMPAKAPERIGLFPVGPGLVARNDRVRSLMP